jgi:FtsZ-interacting cell division protein ZipA
MILAAQSGTFAEPVLGHIPLSFHLLPGGLKEILIVIGAVTAISLVVLGWVVFFRKPGRRHHHLHHHHHRPELPNSSDSEPRRKWRRRRRHDSRPRNPTLAETGGLPPARSVPTKDSGL